METGTSTRYKVQGTLGSDRGVQTVRRSLRTKLERRSLGVLSFEARRVFLPQSGMLSVALVRDKTVCLCCLFSGAGAERQERKKDSTPVGHSVAGPRPPYLNLSRDRFMTAMMYRLIDQL